MSRVRGMWIGSLRCRVEESGDAGLGDLLAEMYGTTLVPAPEDEEVALDIRLRTQALTESPATDRLAVAALPGRVVLTTDPLVCELTEAAGRRRAEIVVTDPTLDRFWLGYHLWIVCNRVLLALGYLVLHAAAVRIDGRVDVFCGHSGAGKSTLATALGLSGGVVLAEDQVLVGWRDGGLAVSGTSPRVRVTEATEAYLLPGRLVDAPVEMHKRRKKVFPGRRFFDAQPHRAMRPDRLFLMRVGEGPSIRPARPKDALLELIDLAQPMLRFADEPDYAAFLGLLTKLVQELPAYTLERGEDLADLDTLVRALRRFECREAS